MHLNFLKFLQKKCVRCGLGHISGVNNSYNRKKNYININAYCVTLIIVVRLSRLVVRSVHCSPNDTEPKRKELMLLRIYRRINFIA